jgi:glycosyltransferase involved in cell wall biosynthesis
MTLATKPMQSYAVTAFAAPKYPITQARKRQHRWLQVVSHLDPRYGGLSTAVPALGRHLDEISHIGTSLAAFCVPGEHYEPEGYVHRQLTFWPASRKQWMSLPFRANPLRDEFAGLVREVDGVHIHGLWEASTNVAAVTARKLGIPYIVSAHGMLEPWALRNHRLRKLFYSFLIESHNVRRAAGLHALSNAEARQFIRFGARTSIAVIPNGVDIPASTNESLFLDSFPHLRGKRILLFLSRLHPKKGVDLLLNAWTEISSNFPGAHLVLAGPDFDDTRAALEHMVAAKKLQSSVTFAGMLRDNLKWSAFASSECFVLPSHSEGLSVSILEAMGMGLPVIVTWPCNMPEVREFQTGWVIPTTVPALTAAVSELFQNTPQTNGQIGARGKDLIATRFTWPIVAQQMADFYSWVQGAPAPATLNLIHP